MGVATVSEVEVRAHVIPDLSREQIIQPASPLVLPQTSLELRQILGLPEDREKPYEDIYAEQEKVIRTFTEERTRNIPSNVFCNREEANFNYQDQNIQDQLNDRSIQTRLWRSYMVNRLRLLGIKQGAQVLYAMESHIPIHQKKDLDPNAVAKLIRALDPSDELAAIAKFNLAIERARKFYFLPSGYEFKETQDELIGSITTLANAPEDTIKAIEQQFKGRTEVIYHSSISMFCGKNSFSDSLIPIIKQGGLTPKQQETLSKAVIWSYFSGCLPFRSTIGDNSNDRSYEFWLHYSELLNPKIAEQFDRFYPYLIDWASGRLSKILKQKAGEPPSRYSYGEEDGRDFTRGLQYLESTGQLGKLDLLIKAGWDCTGIYRQMKGKPEDLDKALNEAVVFQSDPLKMGWIKAFNEFYFPGSKLPAGNIEYLRKMLENKDSLVRIALITKAFPKLESFKPTDLWVEEGDAVIGLDRYKFSSYLDHILEQNNLSRPDIVVASWIKHLLKSENQRVYNLPKAFSHRDLILYSYLIMNKEWVAGQMHTGYEYFAPNAALINELSSNVSTSGEVISNLISFCRNPDQLNPDLQMRYFDVLNGEEKVRALLNLPADYLNTMDQEFQLTVAAFRQLTPNLQLIVGYGRKELISKCFKKGKPTLEFMEEALFKGFFKEAAPLFTKDVLDSLPVEKRDFFQAVLALPPNVASLLMGEKMSQWKTYFVSGKCTWRFLTMVAKSDRTGEFDSFLSSTDLTHLSLKEVTFWNYYKSIKGKPNLRKFLLGNPYSLDEYVINGKPTEALLEDLAKGVNSQAIREILPDVSMGDLTPEQQAFWSFYPSIAEDSAALMRGYLLTNRDRFGELIVDGRSTLAFLDSAIYYAGSSRQGLIKEILDYIDWSKMPQEEENFWLYYWRNQKTSLSSFLLDNKRRFQEMVVDGQETPLFYQLLLTQAPQTMFDLPVIKQGFTVAQHQNLWRMALGKEVFDRFLDTLPKATDEARNAFTGNKYDRTTEFLEFLTARMPLSQLGLNSETLPVITAYVEKFGLAKNETIYKYFHFLYLFEHHKMDELPVEMKDLGIDSTEQMVQKLAEIKRLVFGEELRDPVILRNFSPFQVQMLANVIGYDSARFGGGNADTFSHEINQFTWALEDREVSALAEGYKPEVIEASSVTVEFNPDAVRENYTVLRQEILEAIDNPPSVDNLKLEVKELIERRIGQIGKLMEGVASEKAQAGMRRDLGVFQYNISKLNDVQDLDTLFLTLLGINFSREDRVGGEGFRGMDSLMRRLLLTKLYQRHNASSGFQENVRIKLSKDEVTAEGIDEIVLTLDEMIKNHVLNLDLANKEKYWRLEVFREFMENDLLRKNFRRVTEKFNPHADKLRQEQARFIKTQTGTVSQVKIIPDRGFVGEMAGYLADVCYVRVKNLLKTYSGNAPERPLVVPYKFIIDDPESGSPKFVGSVLVFEVQTAKGEPALLVRALDIPNESEIDISRFTESLLDKFAGLAKRRGKKKVLVAGTRGTISNYASITNHVVNNYVKGKNPEPVSPRFDFNTYDITNAVYTARII